MNIFQYRDYKAYLTDFLAHLKRRGALTELARCAGCTHSYLSQVLRGKPNLTPDQALAATEFLQLSGREAKYFLQLVLFARAASPALRKHFTTELEALAEDGLRLKVAVASRAGGEITREDRDAYYEGCLLPSVHILSACA